MIQIVNEIMNTMNLIEYGFKDSNDKNIAIENPVKWEKKFSDFYFLQTPEELLNSKCGICWDQVELERKLFEDSQLKFKTYFIYLVDNDMLPSHTFLTYTHNNKYYWFEHAWEKYRGIHEYDNELELLLDIKEKFKNENNYAKVDVQVFIYEYQKPKAHITCSQFYQYIETQQLVKTNKPLYFYHIIDKDADISKGLISIQYMYDNNLYKLFDKNIVKYKNRIINDWNIEKYKRKNHLRREEYIDALNIIRGKYRTNYIYFFRYPPFKKLGTRINELSKYKNIYRINLNDEELQKNITDIFYGYDMSNPDNAKLNKDYYENVSETEYFSRYNDQIEMNFSTLNHIGVSFKDGYCPLKFLEKVEWK